MTTPRQSLGRRLVRRLLTGALLGAVLGAAAAQAAPALLTDLRPVAAQSAASVRAAQSSPSAQSSAVTVSGRGEFADMRFRVSQTRDLANQAISVSWTGGVPTTFAGTQFNTDFVQIMQCWGEDDGAVPGNPGPPRTQCQFGASPTTGRNTWPGNQADDTRQVSYSADPGSYGEDDKYGAGRPFGRGEVPFKSIDGTVVTSDTQNNRFYSYNTTNEIDFGRTGADGTGQEYVEAQTKEEAPHLGCGAPVKHPDGSVTGRSCWLVIVPQGHLDLDGKPYQDRTQVNAGSPVSSTNWRNRIAVRLDFQPVGATCAMGAREVDTTGSELVSDAMGSWQAKLCGTGTVFGYTTVGDSEARGQLTDSGDSLVFTTLPVTGETRPADTITYAPVALSAAVIGFSIERQPRSDAPADVRKRAGTRVGSLDLTPRLVAKLLTESYRNSPWGAVRTTYDDGGPRLTAAKGYDWALHNPGGLLTDPEFLAYNKEFADLSVASNPSTDTDLITAFGHSDLARQVWTWVLADRQARQFLAGVPDDWGMRVNPFFSSNGDLNPTGYAFSADRDDFPKNDNWETVPPGSGAPDSQKQKMTDFHPYVDDLYTGALRTRRGDQLWKSNWDPLATPPVWKTPGPQVAGQRFMLTITDAASAARFGLQTARLRNPAGEFTAPTRAALVAAADKAKAADGVRRIDPTANAKGVYPLSMLVYGAARPAELAPTARKQYADLLRYASGGGQVPGTAPGTLPVGYAPLPSALRAEAATAATALETWKPAPGPGGSGAPQTEPGAADGGTGSGGGTGGDGGGSGTAGGSDGGSGSADGGTGGHTAPGGKPGASPSPTAATGSPATVPVAGGITPSDPGSALRFAVPIGAGLGLLAALGAPFAAGTRLPLRLSLPGGRSLTIPRPTVPARLRGLRPPRRRPGG
ncbi:hypothetical protein ACFZAM_17085 [Streptomyces sp. NPDC008079]|uniref:hypothetical protein n=1 Tax=Streptomyces sp. NPDC008079 TaxID=3364806 RepID=UPI0036EFF96A